MVTVEPAGVTAGFNTEAFEKFEFIKQPLLNSEDGRFNLTDLPQAVVKMRTDNALLTKRTRKSRAHFPVDTE